MNNIFRLIWSAARQCWVVAAEKVSSKGGIPARTVGALSVATLLAASGIAFALPTGNSLVAGQATVSTPSNGQMQINQTSNRAIINWNSFNIASGEAVNISQPNSQAALLNRVVGNSGTEIFGKLSANGQVFLVNANGVLFGRGAEVNVGGLVASSLNINNDDFMNGNLKFFKDGAAGSVTNQGSISAGFAALLGPTVENSGLIVTYKGSAALGAADAVTLNFDPQGLIALKLDQGAYGAQVQNSGIIEADGGRVLLTAKSADDVLKSMVNNSGVIRARTVENKNGEILLLGDMQNGTVKVDGILDATAPTSGNGGFVETSAAHVQVADSARVTTLAANGQNGTWLIDPDGFTIAASGGDMTGAAVQTALAGGNFSIASTSGSGTDGNINVNDAITWNANMLTLNATNDINVNAVMNGKNLELWAENNINILSSVNASYMYFIAFNTININADISSDNKMYFSAVNNISTTASVNANAFSLEGGTWSQIGNNLPSFSATSFNINHGTFIRALGGDGSSGSPYRITDVYGLQGIGSSGMLDKNHQLANNIDASGTATWRTDGHGGYYGFKPIGIDSDHTFNGTFDGLGHTISGLYINWPNWYVGLFGATNSAFIRNIGLLGVNITGPYVAGGLVGEFYGGGTISNAYVTGDVNGAGVAAGGLVGWMSFGTINNCYAYSNVNGWNAGILVGYNYAEDPDHLSVISNSFASGTVSGGGSLGGLVGWNNSTIINSYWDITTSGQATSAGGTGLTTAQMQQQASFSGWDFTNTWRIYEGNSYPLLKAFLTPLTITANNASKTYDGNAYTGGNGVTYSVAGAGASPNLLGALAYSGTSQGAINAGSYVITPTGLYSNQQGYDITFANGSLTIDPAALTAISLNGTRVYDGTNIVNAGIFILSGMVGSETLTLSGAGTVADKNVGVNKPVTLGTLALGDGTNGGLASNYTFTGGTQVATITAAPLTVSTSNVTKTYDGTLTAAGSATVTSGTLFGTDSLSGGSFAFSDANSGTGTKTVSVSGVTVSDGNAGGNYTVSYANNSANTINKAPLTITANNDSKTYSGTAYSGGNGATYSGFVGGENAAVLGGTLAYGGTSQGAVDIGTYSIIPSGLTSGNYTISFANGALTVNAAPPTPPPTTPAGSSDGNQPGQMRDHLVPLLALLDSPNNGEQPDQLNIPAVLQQNREQSGGALGSNNNNLLVVLNGGIRR